MMWRRSVVSWEGRNDRESRLCFCVIIDRVVYTSLVVKFMIHNWHVLNGSLHIHYFGRHSPSTNQNDVTCFNCWTGRVCDSVFVTSDLCLRSRATAAVHSQRFSISRQRSYRERPEQTTSGEVEWSLQAQSARLAAWD